MLDYYRFIWPFIRRLDSERAHGLAIAALRNGLVPVPSIEADPILATRVWGIDFENPVGLAAGFDKNAEAADRLLEQGFGFVEVGTVTPRPQPGNPKPRMFRLIADRGVINRLGFNNQGIEAVCGRLAARRERQLKPAGVLGLNLGKNKDQVDAIADFVSGIERGRGLADYLVINISSPNTPGLRALQARDAMSELVRAARQAAMDAVLLVKIAPDLSDDELCDVSEVALAHRVDGLIVGNTTLSREGLASPQAAEQGGLSGEPLFKRSTVVLRRVYALTEGRLPLIGVGGVGSGAQAYAKIRAGASLVQLYTALIYGGIGLVPTICRELAELLRRDGFGNVTEAVGADLRTA